MHHPRAALIVFLVAAVGLLGLVATTARAGTDPGPNLACSLSVPADPLSAAGLATPYQLSATDPGDGVCDESDSAQAAFVEAAVLDPATGAVSVYHPLVITGGTQPAVAPTVPALPAGAVVAVWFGFNADTLTLTGPGARGAVNGLGSDAFGQFAYINAPAWFAAANRAVAAGKLVVPPLGVGRDGLRCPTTRDFSVVDQDQSDNVGTAYWTLAGQMSPVPFTGGTKMTNGSDEGLLAGFVDPALGCSPWLVPNLDGPAAGMSPSLATNELMAAKDQGSPVARVPLNDPMTVLANGKQSIAKTDLYRAGVDQRFLDPRTDTPAAYCRSLSAVAPPRLAADAALFAAAPGPAGAATLGTFLADRYAASLVNLGCPALTSVGRGEHEHDGARNVEHAAEHHELPGLLRLRRG